MSRRESDLQRELGVSRGGSQLYAYQVPQQEGWRPPQAFGVFSEEVEAHFASLFPNREGTVFHELLSDLVHVDVHILRPTRDKPFHVAFTTGMSDLPMTVPDAVEDKAGMERAELFMLLPESWDPGVAGQTDADIPYEQYWPIRMLKYLARFPHEYRTWLGWGHTIPNGPEYEPILEGSGMGGVVLLELGGSFSPLTTTDGTVIRLYLVMPVYREEIEYKLEHGMNALDQIFSECDLPIVIDMQRDNYCENITP